MRRYFRAAVFTLFLIAGCTAERDDATSPGLEAALATATPHFLTVPPTAPPLVSRTVRFWAVRGQDREGFIYYKKRSGPPRSSDRLTRFRVRKETVIVLPSGQTLAPGDSVLITMSVVDTLHQILEFKPSGLKFKNRPADLSIYYYEADHDFNGDGVIDAKDAQIESTFRIWRKDATQPWVAQPTELEVSLDEAEIDVSGFTRFAVAY